MDEQNRFEAPATDLDPSGKHKQNRKQTSMLIMHAKRMVSMRRQGGATYLGFLRLTLVRQIRMLVYVAIFGFAAVVTPQDFRVPVVFAFGLMLGIFLAGQILFVQTARLWWISDLFTDWKKVEECAEMDTNDPIPFR